MLRKIVCGQCQEEIREDQLFMHLVKLHQWKIAPKVTEPAVVTVNIRKLATTAHSLSIPKASHQRNVTGTKKPKAELVTLRGTKIMGSGKCDQCKVNHLEHWVYHFSDGSSKKLCRFCKERLLDKAKKRKTDALDHRVPGSAMSGKRSR